MSSLRALALLSAVALSLASPLSTSPHAPVQRFNPSYVAPLHHPGPNRVINDSYIVMFKDGMHPATFDNHLSFLQTLNQEFSLPNEDHGLTHVWDAHIKGYAGKFNSEVVDLIRRQPEVDYVEHDQIVHTMEAQKSAPWGLARISHRPKLSFSTFRTYEYDPRGGEGVDVYVIDTGVYLDHNEFGGRARWGATIPVDDEDIDGNGHGTHCAGTIASGKYGVAKSANIIAVKVLRSNGSGTMSDVVSGVVWATKDAKRARTEAGAELKATGRTRYKGSVANMSLGGGKSRALDDTVNRAVKSGLHFAVAAGNDNNDACDYSPAAAELAVTVGASTVNDGRAYFSNHGSCVDVFAPGLNILSTWKTGPHSVNSLSGTSMASPHTAGLLAYLLSLYPSINFNPSFESLVPSPLEQQYHHPCISLTKAYSIAYEFLPSWATLLLPSPSFFAPEKDTEQVAPIPPTLTPEQLKKALLALATPDMLDIDNLPEGSPNLVIFNNATDEHGHHWIVNELFPSL